MFDLWICSLPFVWRIWIAHNHYFNTWSESTLNGIWSYIPLRDIASLHTMLSTTNSGQMENVSFCELIPNYHIWDGYHPPYPQLLQLLMEHVSGMTWLNLIRCYYLISTPLSTTPWPQDECIRPRRGADTSRFTGHGWLMVNTGHMYIFLTDHRAQVPASGVT